MGRQSNSAPYAIPARESYLVFVSSEGHIKEVENSPQDQLSFHQAMEDVRHHRSTYYVLANIRVVPET